MLGKIQMSIFRRILQLVKIIFQEKVMSVLEDKDQAVRDVNVADLSEVLNFDFLGICMVVKGS
jgi:hypothetical protein